jgi:hypothetical protein
MSYLDASLGKVRVSVGSVVNVVVRGCPLTMAHDGKDQGLFVFYLSHSLSLTTIIMAYNREWDRGKDTAWSNQQSWQGVRPRGEDDYHGDGKRRKFNNGVRIHILAYQPHLTLSRPTTFLRFAKKMLMVRAMATNKLSNIRIMHRTTAFGGQPVSRRNGLHLQSPVHTSFS